MNLQLRRDPDKGSREVWFMRGPQVLAVDSRVEEDQRLPAGWWGEQVFTVAGKRANEAVRLLLVPFAEAGQNKEPYSTMLPDLELDSSAQVVRREKKDAPGTNQPGGPAK